MSLLKTETINYLITFLLGIEDAREATKLISYSTTPSTSKITIIPTQTLTPNPEPSFINNTPIFHGTPEITRHNNTIILHADLITTAFYLLSRYDEYTAPTAHFDSHSRFLPEHSLLGSHNLLRTPILDQYTTLIYSLLNQEPPKRKTHIYLTHDIDTISLYRRPRSVAGALLRTLKQTNPHPLSTVLKSLINPKNDPAYSFPLIETLDTQLPNAEIIYFLKPNLPSSYHEDLPLYNPNSPLLDILRINPRNQIGIHSLYNTYSHPETLTPNPSSLTPNPSPKNHHLSSINNHSSAYHRSHYLRILPPEKMHLYCEAGITDDFTLAYASTPGFRLGTTRPTLAIDPSNGRLLPLTLHPLTLMDTTLSDPRYLHLNEHEAYTLATSLIDTTLHYSGDITLLFHNTSFSPSSYHQSLYTSLLQYIKKTDNL